MLVHPGLVALSALICLLGSWITTGLLRRVIEHRGSSRAAWIFLGAVTGGATIWCTHFVAMIAYRPGADVAYEPMLTGLSLAIAIAGCALALGTAAIRVRFAPLVGGVLFGASVASMHFVGMAAFAVEGVIHWSGAYVAASIIGSLALGGLAFHLAARGQDGLERLKAAAAMVLGIVCLISRPWPP
jgi:NO-binding membrane sensor protein with MHYT domain